MKYSNIIPILDSLIQMFPIIIQLGISQFFPVIYAKGNWTFCTKDFSDKSFSTSFGLFAQFLVVISHNNYK